MTERGNMFAVKLIALSLFGCAAEPEPVPVPDTLRNIEEVNRRGLEQMKQEGAFNAPRSEGDPTFWKEREAARQDAHNGAYRKTRADWYGWFIEQGYSPDEANVMAGKMMRP